MEERDVQFTPGALLCNLSFVPIIACFSRIASQPSFGSISSAFDPPRQSMSCAEHPLSTTIAPLHLTVQAVIASITCVLLLTNRSAHKRHTCGCQQ
jgi:hypothetical protein